ncbi:hypothetical protein H0H93_009328 [Arthromyces matolae]|nr:hypothetical protein H0H93_009328 [Arthromyces matolae]
MALMLLTLRNWQVNQNPYTDELEEGILRMMTYVTSTTPHVHVIARSDQLRLYDASGRLSDTKVHNSGQGLTIVDQICGSKHGVNQLWVLALPGSVVIGEAIETQLEKLEARGVIIVSLSIVQALPRGERKFKLPKGALVVAPPGDNWNYNTKSFPDLWVYTFPENYVDAVLRATGVVAQVACEPSNRTRIKEAVMDLAQKRSDRSKVKILVLKPVVPGPPNLPPVSASEWPTKELSNPGIYLHTRNTMRYIGLKYLPGLWDVFGEELKAGSKRPNPEDRGDSGQHGRPRKTRSLDAAAALTAPRPVTLLHIHA